MAKVICEMILQIWLHCYRCFVGYRQDMTANISQWQLEMSQLECLLDEQHLTINNALQE
jgi:hypothetical protein